MHFGFALDLSDIDLFNTDLLDQRYTRLYLVFPRRLDDVFKTCLQDFFKTCLDVLKTSSAWQFFVFQDVFKTSWRRLQDVLEDEKLLRWRRVEDALKTNNCLLGKGMGIYFEKAKLRTTEELKSCKEKLRVMKIASNKSEIRISEVRKTGSLL